jgi:outer membrane protein assembly factor BamB
MITTNPQRPRPLSIADRLSRRAGPAIVAAVVVAILTSAAPARADDWATLGLDPTRARLSAERSGATFTDGRWSFSPAGQAGALASPVVADGFVVSAELDGSLTALAADSGRTVWQVALNSPVQATPAISNGRVFIPIMGSKIVAVGLADGKQLWSTNLGGLNVSSPAIVDGDVVVGAGLPAQFVVRLDGATGAIIWQTPPGMEEFSNTPPAVGGELVVVGTNGGHYYAFDAATGLPRWDYRADGIVNIAAPLIVGGRVYLAGGQESDHVHAVDAATGLAIAGWPISLPVPDPDLAGTEIYRRRSVSSFASAEGVITLETRLDDALDTDGDGLPDHHLSREWALALDPSSGAVSWQHALGRVVFTDPNSVPGFVVCPTPAAFTTAAGKSLLVAASSLVGTVSILDAGSGTDEGDLTVEGRALASPVMANGRIITVAEDGTVEGQLSSVNHPPTAPVLAANPRPLDAADVTLHWSAAMDLDGEQVTYELRIDSDGEVLESYAQQIFPGQGATSVAVTAPMMPGVTYTFAVRARDPEGALSSWSAPETFTVETAGTVTVNGTPATNLRSAVAAAQAGDLVVLGAGTYPLSDSLHVAGGVSVRGAGAGRTTIDATGLAAGVSFDGTDPKTATVLDGTTVTGAATCVAVGSGATGVRLTHLVARDCATAGIAVAGGGGAAIANATIVGNGIGVDATGVTTIKNSLVTGNRVGLQSEGSGDLASSYDDLFGNTSGYAGLVAGTGDLAAAVTFVDLTGHNLMLAGPQPSTDEGDPSDAVGEEPTPNGARINLGAFGGTADAELSVPAAVTGDPGSSAPTPATPTRLPPEETPVHQIDEAAGGCALGGRSSEAGGSWLVLAVALAAVLIPARRGRRSRPPRR